MGTTNLFVELVVIGVGAAIWIGEIVLACFGYGWIDEKHLQSTLVTVVSLALIYILGIVTDRIADGFFEGFLSKKLKRGVYGARANEFHDDRRLLLGRPASEVALFEYGRSPMRICRGWTVNALLIAIATNILIWNRFARMPHVLGCSIGLTCALLVLAAASYYSWVQLKRTEFVKTQETADFVRRTSLA